MHASIWDLTTVRQDVESQGRRAGALMLDALHGTPLDPQHDEVLGVELVVRGSTAPPDPRQLTPPSPSESFSGSRR